MHNLSLLTVLRFSLQLFICEVPFLISRKRREHFPAALALSLAVHFALSYLWYFLLRLIPVEHPLLNAVFFLGVAAISIAACMLCFELSSSEAVFIATCGYATEHIAFTVTRITMYLFGISSGSLNVWTDFLLTRLINYMAVAALIYRFVVRPRAAYELHRKNDPRNIVLMVCAVIAAVVLSSTYTFPETDPKILVFTDLICPLYSLLCCLLILVMEYYVLLENQIKLENEEMEHLMQMAESQRRSSKEAIDIINMRCHDLKHQMKALLEYADNDEKREYVESLRQATIIYDAGFQTGNKALDYILYEKKLLSDENNIEFTCMADGHCLDDIKKPDLYALLGNALDNAIEHLQTEAEDSRMLFLSIYKKGQMAHIRIENTCTSKISFIDGVPQTTKADATAHGFGVKSIMYIADKYGGSAFMEVRGGRFCTDIILPAPK